MGAARHDQSLFVRLIQNLEAESVYQHPVHRIDNVEAVDHSFGVEPGWILLQKSYRGMGQLVVEAEMHIYQHAIGKTPASHLPAHERVQANTVFHTITPPWR
jgi:hypothetical protein